MSSPITFSGFNNIDFSTVVNALIAQDSVPLTGLQANQTALNSENAAYGTLATKLATLDAAASALADPATVTTYQATSSNSAAVNVSAGAGVAPGQYDVVVSQLARAQVTVSNTTAPDANTTTVATGGSLVIGGVTVNVTGNVTLSGLAAQINQTTGIGVQASVLQSAPGSYRLVLTSQSTGQANAFTVTNNLTGSTVGFTDTNGDGVSGDSAADNAINAQDASLTVNNIPVTSSTNTLTDVVQGATVTLGQQDPSQTVSLTIAPNNDDLTTRVQNFIAAYNDLVSFSNDQRTQDASGTAGTLARDPVLTGVISQLRSTLLANYSGGTFDHLSEVGIGFDQNGQLTLDSAQFSAAVAANPNDVNQLFTGTQQNGAFSSVHTLVTQYTQSGGFIPLAQDQLTDELSRLAQSITDMQNRLAVERTTLQQEFTAADLAISQLNSQASSLSAFGNALSSSSLSSSSGSQQST